MAKDEDKKEDSHSFPWKEILAFLGVIIAAYIGYLGIRSPIEIPIQATQTAEAKLTQSANNNPTQFPLPPTESPTPEIALNDYWSGALQVRMPTTEESKDGIFSNIWRENSIKISDLRQPETVTYYGVAQKNKEYILPIYWCAKSKLPNTLNENLASMTFEFSVNGEVIPEKYTRSYIYIPDATWKCNSHAIMISGWDEKIQYKFEIKRTLTHDLNDGQSDYLAGEYIYKLVIDVQ